MATSPRRTPTIYDVARAAEVSPTTVSHAYSGKRQVDPSTRARILEVAATLGYTPSRAARALRASRTNTIAFIVPAFEAVDSQAVLTLDYYTGLVIAAGRGAFARGYSMVIAPSIQTSMEIRSLSADGVILVDPVVDDHRVDLCAELDVPLVTIGRDPDHPAHTTYVCADYRRDMVMLLTHLDASGARRIGLIAPAAVDGWGVDNRSAYLDWCRSRGQEPLVEFAPESTGRDSGAEAAGRLLDRPDPPDALIALHSTHAFGALAAARRRRLAVPRDLLLATGIDSARARFGSPSVTAIDLDPDAQGAAAVELLIDLLEGEQPAHPLMTTSELCVRRSTTRPRPRSRGTRVGQARQ